MIRADAGSRGQGKQVAQMLDSAFRSTCRTLFTQELGGLEEYAGYLSTASEPVTERKSSLSGENVYLYYCQYPEAGNFASYGELNELPRPKADINAIKDMDSLLEAVREGFFYCGNKTLGKCTGVEASDACMDAFYVRESNAVYDSGYVANSSYLHGSKFIFGSTLAVFVNSAINAYYGYRSSRLFESGMINFSSDVYFCWYAMNCTDCMFSFNQWSKKNMIGNVELPREKYQGLKKKLLGEVAETLRRKKSFPSIFEIVKGAGA